MHERKGPSVNLKNINFINKVEDYERGRAVTGKYKSVIGIEFGKDNTTDKNYYDKHAYMMKEKILSSFKTANIPFQDKRTIEIAFNNELKDLKHALEDIKTTRKDLFGSSNEIYYQIDRINANIGVFI